VVPNLNSEIGMNIVFWILFILSCLSTLIFMFGVLFPPKLGRKLPVPPMPDWYGKTGSSCVNSSPELIESNSEVSMTNRHSKYWFDKPQCEADLEGVMLTGIRVIRKSEAVDIMNDQHEQIDALTQDKHTIITNHLNVLS